LATNDYICNLNIRFAAMIRFRIFLSAVFASVLCACSNNSDETEPPTPPTVDIRVEDFAGEWQLTQWSGDSGFAGEVYLRLNADLSFELFQNIASQGFRTYTGHFAFDPSTARISGSYSDGSPWGYVYVLGALTSRTMQWQAVGSDDISTYTRTSIPELRTPRAPAPAGIPFL